VILVDLEQPAEFTRALLGVLGKATGRSAP